MWCPSCESADTSERRERAALGYRRFRCRARKREVDERSCRRLNHRQYPTDVVCLVVLWRVRYKLSLRDLAEMFLERGVVFTHEAVREWEAKLAPVLSETLRKQRRGKNRGKLVRGRNLSESEGALGPTSTGPSIGTGTWWMSCSVRRQDQAAAEAFFRSARTVTDCVPERVTTDGHSPYPGALKAELGETVRHRRSHYLNNHLEQDHRGTKQRAHPMHGFKHFGSAARFCRVYDEVRNFFRVRSQRNEAVSLAWQRSPASWPDASAHGDGSGCITR